MAGILNIAYSVLVLLVALAGLVFVFSAGETTDSGNADGGWSRWALALVVVAFLAVMVGGLVT